MFYKKMLYFVKYSESAKWISLICSVTIVFLKYINSIWYNII